MGTDRSRDQYEGILIMDPRIAEINAAGTTATEDSPQTGPITADAGFSTEAVIVASGTPEDGDSLELLGMRAGSPGVNRAGFAWREDGDPTWYGWDVPSVITAFEFVEDATSVNTGFPNPQPIPLADGAIVILAGDDTFNTRGVSRRIRNVDGTYGASVQLFTETANPTNDRLHPRGILLESGRLFVYHATMDITNETAQVRMMYSDSPSDAIYPEGEAGVLVEPYDLSGGASLDRIRIARSPDTGQFLLSLEGTDSGGDGVITQYASRSGVRFEQVGATVACEPNVGHDLAYVAGYFVLLYTRTTGADPLFPIGVRRIGSAFSALSSAEDIIPPFAVARTNSGLSLVAGDDEMLYLYGRTGVFGFGVSEDAGRNWLSNPGDGIRFGGQGVLFEDHSAAFYRGYVYMVANQSAPAVNQHAITAARLGGYSDLTLPPETTSRNVGRQMWYEDGWMGHEAPDVGPPFSNFSVGAPFLLRQTDGSWGITTGVGDQALYRDSGSTSVASVEFIAWARIKRNSGQFTLEITNGDLTPADGHVRVEVDADIRLQDFHGGNIGTVPGVGALGIIDIVVATQGTNATAWYSDVDDGDHRRTWVQIGTTSALGTGGNTARRIEVIVENSSNVQLYGVQYSRVGAVGASSVLVGQSMADDFINPDDLFAKSLPAIGASYVNDDVSIRGADGPLLRGEEFTMEITHPSPIESILPSVQPSPRKYWLSSDAAADQEIVLGIGSGGEETHSGSDLIGIAILNCNAQNVRVETRNTAGTWDLRTDIFRGETGLDFIRDGNTIKPDITTTSTGQYYQRNELAGSYFIVNVGTGDTRTIIGNTEGHFTSGATIAEKRCIIYLDADEMDGTEATSGATGAIVHRDTVTYLSLEGDNLYRAYKLTLNDSAVSAVDTPPGGKLRMGIAVVGPVVVFGKRQDNAYSVTRESQVESQRLIDGTQRSRVLAPSRRTMTINFNDGVDVTTARGSGDADYVTSHATAASEPVAHVRDLPLVIDGLIDQLDGPHTPIVYCPNIPRTSGSIVNSTFRAGRAGGTIYGRITSAVGLNAVVGDPMLTEVFTGPSITIEEEV